MMAKVWCGEGRGKGMREKRPFMIVLVLLTCAPFASSSVSLSSTGELELRMIYNTSDQSNQSRSEIEWPGASTLSLSSTGSPVSLCVRCRACCMDLLPMMSPLYTDGSAPRDGPHPITVPYPLWSVVIVSVVTGIGMVCALICLVVTVAYRKHR